MISPIVAADLEQVTVALNALLWNEGVGLAVPPSAYDVPSAALTALYARLLDDPDPVTRAFAVDGWAESRRVAHDVRLTEAMDEHLVVPELAAPDGPLTWRNWKPFERAAADATQLNLGFEGLVARSVHLTPVIEARAAQLRADFAAHGLTLPGVWAAREGLTPEAIRALLRRVGRACREPFATALDQMSFAVFGRPAGPAELRALYLNRMYEPTNDLFQTEGAVAAAQRVFDRIGFGLDQVRVDVEDRPRKAPGAFCLPVHVPADVRVSVRVASPHHLVDMLYHEFGHAVHFAGIRADLPFVDRNWIFSGTHETFSTLFEKLLAEPQFLRSVLGFDEAAVRRLLAFARYSALLTATWLGAAALTSFDAWLEGLEWPQVEVRYAAHLMEFTGVSVPPGFARLEGFTPALTPYPAGYVLAHTRVASWLRHLRALGGEAWWDSPAAQSDIRARIAAGAGARFPDQWNQPDAYLADVGATDGATGTRDGA